MADADDPTTPAASPYLAPADLARLAEYAFDMFCLAADGRLIAVNPAFERILGWSAETLTSRPFFDFVHPEDIPSTTAAWEQLLRGETLVDFENRYRHRDGDWRWIQWRAGRLDDGRVHATARDVTVQHRDRMLVERTHRIARVGGWQLDFRSGQLYWTRGTYRLHEVEPDSFRVDVQTALAFYAPDDRMRVGLALHALHTHGTPFDFEAHMVTGRGRAIIVRAEGIPIVEGGEVVGAFGAVGDITERRRAERQLRRMETVLRASPQAVFFTDTSRRLQWFNPATAAMLGINDRALGRPSTDFFSDATIARFEQQVLPLMRQGQTWQGPVEAIASDGTLIPGRTTTVLHRDAEGRPDFISAAVEDLRSQRTLERQVRHSQRIEAIGRLAGGLAHDFNNLLTVVLANADELADALEDDGLRSLASEITDAARRGAALTRRLLAYARRDVAQPQAVDLFEVCSGLASILRRTLGARIRIRVVPDAENWPVHIDPTHLDQLMMNLAMNARDAMPDGGELTFHLAALPGHGHTVDRMRLTVSDTGIGMPPKVLAQATDPFFTTKDRDHGTGLGLATCLGLVDQAGGTLRIESREGEGTRVMVELPRAPRQPLAPVRPEAAIDGRPTGQCLMLIEDEDGIRRVLARGLTQLGYDVEAFGTAELAIDAVRNRGYRPALIISDVVLPGMDGPTAVRQMRDILQAVPVIFASGYATEKLDRMKLDGLGARLVRKPCTPRDLEPLLRELLD